MNISNKYNNNNPKSSTHTRSNGSNPACASCKYQRRKCTPDCILAPYFPHDRQRQFLNAHKLFGVSNITKLIKNLDQPHRDLAMCTIVIQSDARASDPVGGCFRIIQDLNRQIQLCHAELDLVLHHLAFYRAQAQAQAQEQQQQQDELNLNQVHVRCNDFEDPAVMMNNNYQHLQGGLYQQQLQQEQGHYVLQQNGGGGDGEIDNQEGPNVDVEVPLQDISAWAMHDTASPYSLQVKQPSSSVTDCDDFKRF